MMSYKLCFILLLSGFSISQPSSAKFYNTVNVRGYSIILSKQLEGSLEVKNTTSGEFSICKIKGWGKELSSGAGEISLTSDKIGLIISSGNKYLKMQDVLTCNGNPISLYSIPYLNDDIAELIDINFEKEIALAFVVIDTQAGIYQAIISKFNGMENILSGKGFWNDMDKEIDDSDYSFSVGDTVYLGKISPDGQYVSPNDLDCSIDSFPGVWDIKRKMKVTFLSSLGDDEIKTRCQKLFDGKAILEELGGKLIRPKE